MILQIKDKTVYSSAWHFIKYNNLEDWFFDKYGLTVDYWYMEPFVSDDVIFWKALEEKKEKFIVLPFKGEFIIMEIDI